MDVNGCDHDWAVKHTPSGRVEVCKRCGKVRPSAALPFSQTLTDRRQKVGLSLGALSRATGISKAHLWQFEQGGCNPTVRSLMALSKPLRVAASRLASLAVEQIQNEEIAHGR